MITCHRDGKIHMTVIQRRGERNQSLRGKKRKEKKKRVRGQLTEKAGRVMLAIKKICRAGGFFNWPVNLTGELKHFTVHMKNFCHVSLTSAALVLFSLTRPALIYLSSTTGLPARNQWRARLDPCSAVEQSPLTKWFHWYSDKHVSFPAISYNKRAPRHFVI